MDKLFQHLEWLSAKLKMLGACCLMGMTFLTCADVVGRYFRHPIYGSVEIVGFMATLSCIMALPYTHQVKGHIGVELLVRLLSERTQTIIEICTNIISLLLFAVVTWCMAQYALTMQRSGEVSISLQLSEHWVIYITAFCFLIFALVIAQDVVTNIRKLSNK
jgi:TRAP-type C4-dicarboxylate transport system permease small subunit